MRFKDKENTCELLVTEALAPQVTPDSFKCFLRAASITSKDSDLKEVYPLAPEVLL